MRIFGPLVCATTSPVTATRASASASVVTSSPSTSRSAGRSTRSPGSPTIFSTSTTSPTATLYCLPPVLTMAYIDALLLGCVRARNRVHVAWASWTGYGPAGGRVKPPRSLGGHRLRRSGRAAGRPAPAARCRRAAAVGVPAVRVPAVRVPAVRVPAVRVPAVRADHAVRAGDRFRRGRDPGRVRTGRDDPVGAGHWSGGVDATVRIGPGRAGRAGWARLERARRRRGGRLRRLFRGDGLQRARARAGDRCRGGTADRAVRAGHRRRGAIRRRPAGDRRGAGTGPYGHLRLGLDRVDCVEGLVHRPVV